MKKQTILITGGTGFLGHNLCRYLIKKDWSVRSIDVAPFNYADLTENVDVYDGDICNSELLEKAMDGVDVVANCAAALPSWKKDDIISSNVEGHRNVMETALKKKVKRVIHISSAAVYGVPDHAPLLEEDERHAVGMYGETKIMGDKICEEYRNKGLCVSVLCPVTFLGPGRLGIFSVLYDWVSRGKNIPLIGDGSNKYQLLDVDDLIDAIYLCMTLAENKVNDYFNIGSEKFGTMYEDFSALVKSGGYGKRVVKTPANVVISSLRILEALKLSPVYKWVYECAVKDCYVSNDKIKEKIGWKSKYSNQDTLIRTYKWYVEHRDECEDKSGVTHRVPWKQGALKIFRRFF